LSESAQLSGSVERLLPGGEAVVDSDGSIYLVANVVPGDTIKFQPTEKRRGARRGELASILEPSPVRVEPPCSVAELCGGCSLQYLDPEKHGDTKSGWVLDIFDPFLDSESEWIPAEGSADLHRRRVRWFVETSGEDPCLGFRARASHSVVRHEHCMVLTQELNKLRLLIESAICDGQLLNIDSVQALQLSDGIHVVIEGGVLTPELSLASEIDGLPLQLWHRINQVTRPVNKPVIPFHDFIQVGDGQSVDIRIGPDDFVQGQQEGNQQMISQIIEWSSGARFVVDLFSGVGNLSLPVAKFIGAKVAGAEVSQASVQAANANAKRLNLDAHYQKLNLFESFDSEPFAGADMLILDPPRRGAKKVCGMIGRLLPAKIIMINCDPASGGRDAVTLQSHGYRLQALRAFDLFPYAGHVEAMSLWTR